MFTLHQIPGVDSLILAKNNDPAETIYLDDLRQLLELRRRLEQYIYDQQPDAELDEHSPLAGIEFIDTVEARQLAAEAGFNLPPTTLISAISNGHIIGGRKNGGRWTMPRHAFVDWFRTWQERSA